MLEKDSKIYIAGHKGMVGSACWRELAKNGYSNLVGKTSKELDLRNQKEVKDFLFEEKPIAIIAAAAKVGGIMANATFPYEFLLENMQIQNNLISIANELEIPKFIFLGSSCIYPKFAPQPLKEEYLLTDSLEPTNQWYAIAKISGVKLIEALRIQYGRDYVALMPTNLFGPGDNYDLNSSHVLPAMIRKFHEAKHNNQKEVKLWGDGSPMREFLYVDDLANAVKFILESKADDFLYNVGTGKDIKIMELAEILKSTIGFEGTINWDESKPNGTPRKLMDCSKIESLGWHHKTDLLEGISNTYKAYLESI